MKLKACIIKKKRDNQNVLLYRDLNMLFWNFYYGPSVILNCTKLHCRAIYYSSPSYYLNDLEDLINMRSSIPETECGYDWNKSLADI